MLQFISKFWITEICFLFPLEGKLALCYILLNATDISVEIYIHIGSINSLIVRKNLISCFHTCISLFNNIDDC